MHIYCINCTQKTVATVSKLSKENQIIAQIKKAEQNVAQSRSLGKTACFDIYFI